MVASGILTSTMVYAAIAPNAAMVSNLGETLSGPAAEVAVRCGDTQTGQSALNVPAVLMPTWGGVAVAEPDAFSSSQCRLSDNVRRFRNLLGR
jgi:hypothetical protein